MSENHVEDVLEIGKWLGRRQAFSMVAGRCSECCRQDAGIARSSAEPIIRNLEECGPDYFGLAQVTGITANEYRCIQGSVRKPRRVACR
jgi:hypothetical protein